MNLNQLGFFEILTIISPVFIIAALGFFSVKRNIVDQEGIRALARFIVNFAAPAIMFKSVSSKSIDEVIHTEFLLVYVTASLLAFASVFFATKYYLKKPLTTCAIYGMGGSLPNSLMVGFAVATALMGEKALVAFALVLLVETFLILPLTLVLADIGQDQNSESVHPLKRVFSTIVKNPLIVAIFVGLIFSTFQIPVPKVAAETMDLLAKTVSGVGMFMIGGLLVGFKLQNQSNDLILISVGKLIIHPLLALVFFLLMFPNIEKELLISGVVFAAVPTFSVYAAIATPYGLGSICSAAQVKTLAASFFTIPLVIWLLAKIV